MYSTIHSGALRACACFGVDQLVYTGSRIDLSGHTPREFRHKDYKNVTVTNVPIGAIIPELEKVNSVALEIVPGAQNLVEYKHDFYNSVYVFGSEDATIPSNVLRVCKSHIKIPSNYCVNLSAAVYITLYDRVSKLDKLTNPWEG